MVQASDRSWCWIQTHRHLWGLGCWHVLMWLQGLAMGMHTVVEVGYGGLGWCHEHMDLQRLELAEIQH